MSTHSLTLIYDDNLVNPFFSMYRQYDGYPSGHGADLAEFLKPFTMVNGLGLGGDNGSKIANGAGCLAAQIVAHFKNGPGGIYIQPATARDCWQDYEYHIYVDDTNPLTIKVISCGGHNNTLFAGDVEAFEDFCKSDD